MILLGVVNSNNVVFYYIGIDYVGKLCLWSTHENIYEVPNKFNNIIEYYYSNTYDILKDDPLSIVHALVQFVERNDTQYCSEYMCIASQIYINDQKYLENFFKNY